MVTTLNMQYLVWPFLTVVASLGLFALINPNRFRQFALRSSKWVDTDKVLATMDKQIEIDRVVLRYCRTFGLAVVLASGLLAYLYVFYYLVG